jgi:hypothetical protein
MNIPLVLLALTQAGVTFIPSLVWDRDYRTALQKAEATKRPLAVFIASGKAGWQTVSRERELSAEVQQLLMRNYVCLYIDTDEPAGKELAASFEVTRGPALVLSDQTRSYQAYRQVGAMETNRLAQVLQQYQAYQVPEPARIEVRPSYYQPVYQPVTMSRSAVVPCRT